MVKGTITTKDFYGKVSSIDTWKDLETGDTIINKESGKKFTVLSISILNWQDRKSITYRIRGNNNIYEKSVELDTIKLLFWKVVA